MSSLRVIFLIFLAGTGFLRAQGGSAYDENRRLEEMALNRARQMKAIREQAMYEPPPRDLNPPKAAPATVSTEVIQRQPEPFYFRVVTPEGLVPLDEWRVRQEQARIAAASPPPPPPPQPVPQQRSVRLAFLSLGSPVERSPEEGRALALNGPGGRRGGATPAKAEPASQTVAVMEEVPSPEPGGVSRHRLLGFLSGNGLEAALGEASETGDPAKPGSEKFRDRIAQRAKSPSQGEVGPALKPESSPGSEGLLVEEKLEKPIGPGGADQFWNGLGQWLASARTERSSPSPGGGPIDPEDGQFEATHADFFTIKATRAPFHVIDDQEGETHLVELDAGTVGRNHGEGEDWAWMQLDSGLMGLMQKRYLRPSRDSEVNSYLASESGGNGPSVAANKSRPVRYIEVDLPALPSEAADSGAPLGGGLFPMAAGASQPPAKPDEEVREVEPAESPEMPAPSPSPAPASGGILPADILPLP